MLIREASLAFALLVVVSLAPAQRTTRPAFLAHVPADHDNIFYLGDVVPPLRRLLGSKALSDLYQTVSLAFPSQGRQAFVPRRLGAALQLVSGMFPAEVCLALPSSSQDSLGAMLQATLLVWLSAGTNELGGESLERDLPRLQARMLELIRPIGKLRFRLFLKMRDAHRGELLYDEIGDLISDVETTTGVAIDEGDSSLAIRIALGARFTPEEISDLLQETTLVTGPDDPMLERLVNEIGKLVLQVRIALVPDGLLLTFGAPGHARPLRADDLGKLWRRPAPVLWAKWDSRRLATTFSDYVATWNKWKDSALGRWAQEDDEDGIIESMTALAQLMSRSSKTGSLRLEIKDDITLSMREELPRGAVDLENGPLSAFIPEDPDFARLDGTSTLGELLASVLLRVEDRLGNQWLRAWIGGDTAQLEKVEALSNRYFDSFRDLREFLLTRAPDLFEPPVGMLVTGDGQLRVFLAEPKAKSRELVKMAIPAVAFLGKPRQGTDGAAFVAQMFEALVRGTGGDAAALEARMSVDLGLGVPTWTIPISALPEWVRTQPLRTGEDAVWHAFTSRGLLVFSTSVRLSKRLLAVAAGKERRFRLPATQGAQGTLGVIDTSGPRLAEILVKAVHAARAVTESCLPADQAKEWHERWTARGGLMSFSRVAAGLLRLLGPLCMVSTRQGSHMLTEARIVLPEARRAQKTTETAKLLARVREAVGASAGPAKLLAAHGTCRHLGAPGKFHFLFAADGRFAMEIRGALGVTNGWDGKRGWSKDETGMPRPSAGRDFEMHRLFAWVLGGHWLHAGKALRIEARPDGDDRETVLHLRLQGGTTDLRLRLDPKTLRPSVFDYVGARPLRPSKDLHCELGDWRPALGMTLPHRISVVWDRRRRDEYVIESWTEEDEKGAFAFPEDEPRDTEFMFSTGMVLVLKLEPDPSGLPAVPAEINGRTAGRFILDPGLWRSVLDRGVAKRVGTSPLRGKVLNEDDPWADLQPHRVAWLGVAGVRMRNFSFELRDMPTSKDGWKTAGKLGYDFFRRCLVELDLGKKSVAFYPPGSWRDRKAPWLDLSFDSRTARFPVRIEGEGQARFSLEMSFPHAFALDLGFLKRHGLLHGRRLFESTYGLDGMSGWISSLQIGGIQRRNVKAVFWQPYSGAGSQSLDDGMLGGPALSGLHILIDYPSARIAFLEDGAEKK